MRKFLIFFVFLFRCFAYIPPSPVVGFCDDEVKIKLYSSKISHISSDYRGFSWQEGDTFFIKMPSEEKFEVIKITIKEEDVSKNIEIPFFSEKKFSYKFRYFSPTASTVAVAGTFNNWRSDKDFLTKKGSVFELEKELPPETHQYKFVVDGKWVRDPQNPLKTPDGFGGFNSVIKYEKKKEPAPLDFRQTLLEDNWIVEFLPSVKVGIAYCYFNGKVLREDFDKGKFSFIIPIKEKKLQKFWVWWQDETGKTSKILKVYKNFLHLISWPESVIYAITTDRFYNGNTTNDNPVIQEGLLKKANYMGGDFQGIIEKIKEGYFNRLGVNVLWLSPVYDNTNNAYRDALPPHRFFTGYHGYWPVSFEKVEEHFGTEDDLKNLIKTAHKNNIKVMADMVFNHVHIEHPWWKEHKSWFGKLELPDGTKNIRKFDEYPYTTWFDEFLPSFDYSKKEAVSAVTDNAIWWIENFGFDAFRLDAVKHIPVNFWKRLKEKIRIYEEKTKKKFYLVGETISSRSTINQFIGRDLLHGQFDFPLYWKIRDVFALGRGSFKELDEELKKSITQYKDIRYMSTLLGNHDFPRFMAFADGDIVGDEKEIGWSNPPKVDKETSYEKIKMAFTFILTNPGIPVIFYGDEVALTGAGDPDNRRMMNFNPDKREKEVFEVVSKLIKARREIPALTFGWHKTIFVSDDIFAYLKHYFQNKVLIVFNKSDKSKKIRINTGLGNVKLKSIFSGKVYKIKEGILKMKIPSLSGEVLLVEKL